MTTHWDGCWAGQVYNWGPNSVRAGYSKSEGGPNSHKGVGWRNIPPGVCPPKALESSPPARSLDGPRHRRLVLPQSSSNSRLTAGASGFLNFSQSRDRPLM
jgi:hypothetical protein